MKLLSRLVFLSLLIIGCGTLIPLASSSPQCGQLCTCTVNTLSTTTNPGPTCLNSLTFMIVSSATGCCNTGNCSSQSAAPCSYVVNFTGASNPGATCCYGVFLNSFFQFGSQGALNQNFPSSMSCGASDTWAIWVGNISPTTGCAYPLPGNLQVLTLVIGCVNGLRC